MSVAIKLPELGSGVDHVDVAEVLVAEGDEIQVDQPVIEVESEKAVTEVPSSEAGRVEKIHVAAGDHVKAGQVIVTLAEAESQSSPEEASEADEGKDVAESQAADDEEPDHNSQPRKRTAQKREESQSEEAEAESSATEGDTTANQKRKPARRKSENSREGVLPEHDFLRQLTPGLAVHDDDEAAAEPAQSPDSKRTTGERPAAEEKPRAGKPSGLSAESKSSRRRERSQELPESALSGRSERVPLTRLQRAAIPHLTDSAHIVPQVTQHGQADVTDLQSARLEHNAEYPTHVSLTALVVKAVTTCLQEFPLFNSCLDPEKFELLVKQEYHIGIAVDTPQGLVVPVIRRAEVHTVTEIAASIVKLVKAAQDGKLSPEQIRGATFTISNQGAVNAEKPAYYAGTGFTPLVPWPQVAVLGLSRAAPAVVVRDGQPAVRTVLPLSLSYDHRVINGADAERFITRLSELLSRPLEILMGGTPAKKGSQDRS